jgi:hypothetical protein
MAPQIGSRGQMIHRLVAKSPRNRGQAMSGIDKSKFLKIFLGT